MDKDCSTFEKGYSKQENNHINKNQKIGKNFLILLSLFILSLSLLFIRNYRKNLFVIPLILFLYIIYTIYKENTIPLRAADYIINTDIDTPAFLNLEEYFPNYKYLEEKTNVFQKELYNLLKKTNGGKNLVKNTETIIKVDNEQQGWKIYQIKLGNNIVKTAYIDFPELVTTIKKFPEITNVAISLLEGKSKIPMHIGYYKGIIRYMLPLKVPKDKNNCFLCVNGDKYIWEEGKSVLWDDNFPHKVYNHSEESRVVIFIDVERPKLDWKRKNINKIFKSLINNSSIVKNEIKKSEIKQKLN